MRLALACCSPALVPPGRAVGHDFPGHSRNPRSADYLMVLYQRVRDCVLLCWFHHQVVIHRWGWTLVLNPDGTTTAWNPGRTKTLHSHGPPARAG